MPKVAGTVNTPGYTEDRVDSEFVLVTFTPQGGQPVTIEYYFNKNIYKSPQDFNRMHKTVTVKYNASDPTRYTVYEESKGDYSKYIAAALVGILFGALAVSTSDGSLFDKTKSFLVTFVVASIIVLIVVKLNAWFSFLNILTKRDDD